LCKFLENYFDSNERLSGTEQSKEFLRPFVTDVKILETFLDGLSVPGVDEASFDQWSDENKITPTSGSVYVVRGSYENLKAIQRADGLNWYTNSIKSKKQGGFHSFIAMPDENKLMPMEEKLLFTSGNLDIFKISFKKKIVFLKDKSVFVIHYYGKQSQCPWKKTEVFESLSTVNDSGISITPERSPKAELSKILVNEELDVANGVLRPVCRSKVALDSSLYKKYFKKIETHRTKRLQTWNKKLKIDPKPGNLYVFRGKLEDFSTISKADKQKWQRKHEKDRKSRKTASFIKKKALLQNQNLRKSCFKDIYYFKLNSIYILHYYRKMAENDA